MNTRFWIPFTVIVFPLMFIGMMCHDHRRPLGIDNDSREFVKADFERTRLNGVADLETLSPLEPGDGYSIPFCSTDWPLIYLSTKSHPRFVAYRVQDFCDNDDCSCLIKVSDLERHRADRSVPWERAATLFGRRIQKVDR